LFTHDRRDVIQTVVANAIFTTKPDPAYDDTPEEKYHFPKQYLGRVQETVGDWIIYYEPRRPGDSLSGTGGRQAYFALARVVRIEKDPARSDHFYAYMADYLEFPQPVPFKQNGRLLESFLRNPDGSTNSGAFINAVRLLPHEEFEVVCRLGLAPAISEAGLGDELAIAETQDAYGGPRQTVIASRPVREAAFARVVRNAYDRTCAMTGLKLVNGEGRCEIEAAHIKPVEDNGPDSPRNGIALSRTVHWMFDRGIFSIADDGLILMAKRLVPDQIRRMLTPDGRVLLPHDSTFAPHRVFLRYHRENRYKGD
jgi:putative restriction endonuclease